MAFKTTTCTSDWMEPWFACFTSTPYEGVIAIHSSEYSSNAKNSTAPLYNLLRYRGVGILRGVKTETQKCHFNCTLQKKKKQTCTVHAS